MIQVFIQSYTCILSMYKDYDSKIWQRNKLINIINNIM